MSLSRLPGLILALLVTTLFSSCSSGLYPLDPPALQARGLQPGEGYIVATFRTESYKRNGEKSDRGATANVFTKGTAGAAKGSYPMLVPVVMPFNRNPHLAGGGYPSEEIAIPVPAGDYEITGWSMTGMGSSGPVSFMNRKPLKVSFQVKPGEATYVGSYLSVAINGRNLLGFPIFVEGLILTKDDFAKDQARIAKKYPSIGKARIRNSDAAKSYMEQMKKMAETPKFLGIF